MTATRAGGSALVTGATGLLGRHLVEALVQSGARVRALAQPSSKTEHLEQLGVEVERGSLLDEGDLARAVEGVDVVYHLGGVVVDDPGAISASDWEPIRAINVEGTERLARRAAAGGVPRLVFCSSTRVFGLGNQLLWPENGPRTSTDHYGRSKILAEEALLAVGRETGLEIVIIRPRLIYGNHDRYLLPRLVRHVQRGTVPIVGRDRICDVVYVRDCVQSLQLAANARVTGQSFNITSGECLSLRQILVEIGRALGLKPRILGLPAPLASGVAATVEVAWRLFGRRPPLTRAHIGWFANDHHFSIAKARSELGYRPRYRLADALREIDLRQFASNGAS